MQNVIKAFDGQHCETTATGTLLLQIGIQLSEPMLFGLGEGLGYIFWNMKSMERPFIGGRIKPDLLTANIARNLHLTLTVKETSSRNKAWEEVKKLIDNGKVVGLKLDCYHLDYFTRKFHFAGHYVAIYGYDGKDALLVDTKQQGGAVKTSLYNLANARAEQGPMASKNLFYIIEKTDQPFHLQKSIVRAIKNNAKDYLNPPIQNIGYKGILKTSTAILKWFKNSKDVAVDFQSTAILMEKAGTGGALFRNLYRDFLNEAYALLGDEDLKKSAAAFTEIASLWSAISALFSRVNNKGDFILIEEASEILQVISVKEKQAMELLEGLKYCE